MTAQQGKQGSCACCIRYPAVVGMLSEKSRQRIQSATGATEKAPKQIQPGRRIEGKSEPKPANSTVEVIEAEA